MSRLVFVVGNDGAGKTTYVKRLADRLRARSIRVTTQHYYTCYVRSTLRLALKSLAKHKTTTLEKYSGSRGKDRRDMSLHPSGLRRCALYTFLRLYLMAMALELRIRLRLVTPDVLILDRGYVDDLVSILEILRLPTNRRLLMLACKKFPVHRTIYLYADSHLAYSRISDIDLSRAFHLRKAARYEEIVSLLQDAGVKISHVNTGRPNNSWQNS